MRLETARIQGFRSVEDITLSDCGGFNVLIGKNNAGKSNILLSVDAFFASLRGGEPVLINPDFLGSMDFNLSDGEIVFTMLFRLALAERDALIQDIASEAPQMKNAVDGMDPDLRLAISVAVKQSSARPPRRYAFVRAIGLSPAGAADPMSDKSTRRILEISDAAALEMAQHAQNALRREQDAALIRELISNFRHFDSDDWQRFRMDRSNRMVPRYFFRHASTQPSPEIEARR